MNSLQQPVQPGQIDLHIHTTASDGTDSPAELLAKIRAAGIRIFAITDHDAVQGCEEMIRLLSAPAGTERASGADDVPEAKRESGADGVPEADGLRFLTGVEFSCKDFKGAYHILGYGYDPAAEPVRRLAREAHGVRLMKLENRITRLRTRHGIEFPAEEVEKLRALSNPGKPHIANLMLKYGYAGTREEAIGRIGDSPELRNLSFKPEQAIEAILASGGIPVLAHPSFGNGNQRIFGSAMEERVRYLAGMGLKGLEAYYSEFTPELIGENRMLADRYGLYVTAGSDYHGRNKKNRLGQTHLSGLSELPDGLGKFLRDLGFPEETAR